MKCEHMSMLFFKYSQYCLPKYLVHTHTHTHTHTQALGASDSILLMVALACVSSAFALQATMRCELTLARLVGNKEGNTGFKYSRTMTHVLYGSPCDVLLRTLLILTQSFLSERLPKKYDVTS